MAEDIHDGPAQVLTNAIFQVEYLDRMLEPSEKAAHAELAFLRDMLRNGPRRGALPHRRPAAAGRRRRAWPRQSPSGRSSSRSATASPSRWPWTASTSGSSRSARASVLRILQEALQNVRKHAAASRISIGLEGDTLVIADNGRGFDLMRLASSAGRNFGLQFMRERAELMGAQLHIESRQGEGTRILLRLPEQGTDR